MVARWSSLAGVYFSYYSLVVLLAVLTGAQSKGLMVTAPGTWVAGLEEKICITTHALSTEVVCNIRLMNHYGNPTLFANKTIILQPDSLTCTGISVPKNVSVSNAKLEVSAESINSNETYSFSKSADVNIKSVSQMTFIQTDKPIYKPGDLVRIRILTLIGHDLKVLLDDVSLVYIEDPSKTRVMQWSKVSAINGLSSLEMQLSDEPRLGQWTIIAVIGQTTETQSFAVEEYVLPKYEVTIHHPTVMVQPSSVAWKVCAMYTYGQPVKGTVIKSEACLIEGYQTPVCIHPNANYAIMLKDGCAEFFISHRKMNRYTNGFSSIKFLAEVNESGTGVKINSTSTADVHRSPYKVKFIPEGPDSLHYKPGLPHYGQGQVTHPDNTPAKGAEVQITTTAKHNGLVTNDVTPFPVLTLTSGTGGLFRFVLPGNFTSQNMTSIEQEVKIPKVGKQFSIPSCSRTLQAWYSPTNSFLQIEPFNGVAACRSQLSLPVVFITGNRSTTSMKFSYQLMARGDIVHSGQLTILPHQDINLEDDEKNLHKFNIAFTVTPAMSGSLTLLVYTVLPDGEVVADSLHNINVDQCFLNDVSMSFVDRQKQPGHSTALHLSADPQSLCSVSVVDKSVQLMKKQSNTLTKSKILEMQKLYDVPPKEYKSSHTADHDCGRIDSSDRPTTGNERYSRYFWMSVGAKTEYVDSKKAFSNAGMIILSDVTVVTRPCRRQYRQSYRWHIGWGGGFSHYRRFHPYGEDSDLDQDFAAWMPPRSPSGVEIEDHRIENMEKIPETKRNPANPIVHRSFFPESWLWQLRSVGDSGSEEIRLDLPHTITEWVGNGFCTNTKSGLGVSSPFSINAFQPFFLSFTLPYSMVRGETVGIPVSVFNYLDQCLKVTLYVQKSTAFELMNNSLVNELRVCGHETETHTYDIVPRELGKVNFTIRASSVPADDTETNSVEERQIMTAVDIVTQTLLVEAEGREEEVTKSAFICAPGEGSWKFDSPSGLVQGSVRAYTSAIGDVMGPTLTRLDSLLALPTGCGEQNMLKFSPNIFVMQYLQNTNSMSADIKAKATEYLQTGYQRELTYRHTDGSYSAFGSSDPEGSIWLTAFVVKSFAEARPFIYIDQNDLDSSIKWMTSIQLENGCFPQHGRVFQKEMTGGMANGEDNLASLTAYVVIALLEAGFSPQDVTILKAIECLNKRQVDEVYTQSLMAYAYTMWNRNETKRSEIMNALMDKAVVADGTKHWKMPTEAASTSSPTSIEMTSYILLAILHNASGDAILEAMPIVKWLSAQRNSRGGFSSTQDTVLALQALARYAALVFDGELDARVSFTGTDWNHNATVTPDNRFLLQKKERQTLLSSVQYVVSGTGCVLLQASVKYNVIDQQSDEGRAFELKVEMERQDNNSCKEMRIKICTSYNGADNESNMAVIAVKMVSGWIPEKNSIKKLLNHAHLMLKRFEVEKNMIQLYFDQIEKKEKCFSFLVQQDILVENTKPALVHVYDYYKPSLSTYVDYSIPSTCGTEEIKENQNRPMPQSERGRPSLTQNRGNKRSRSRQRNSRRRQ